MVLIAPIIGAVVLLSGVSALPTRRSESKDTSSYEGSGSGSSYEGSGSYEGGSYSPPEENKCEGSGCDENKYETTSEYENKYTTEENKYTTEENKYTTTSTAEKYHETYGSGKPYWGGSEYQDCVNS
jgi:hypothetical protein